MKVLGSIGEGSASLGLGSRVWDLQQAVWSVGDVTHAPTLTTHYAARETVSDLRGDAVVSSCRTTGDSRDVCAMCWPLMCAPSSSPQPTHRPRDGFGGFPFDIHLAVEKDKTSTCLQGESHLSVVHSVPPFGNRHITQVRACHTAWIRHWGGVLHF